MKTGAILSLSLPTLATATGVLTSDNTNVADGATVTIGDQVYTFKTALTSGNADPYEVLIGADADGSLTNLKNAINGTGTPGTDYDSSTPVNTKVTAGAVTAHAITVTAITSGASENVVATTETSTHLSWGSATLSGGKGGVLNKLTLDASGANYTDPVDVEAFDEIIAFLNVLSHVGATGTLDVKFQGSPDKVTWTDFDSMTQVTTTDSQTIKRFTAIFGKWIRAVITLGGTAPEYKITLSLAGKG